MATPMVARFLWISGRSSRLEWWLVHFGCMAAFALNEAMFTLSTFESGILGTVRVMHPASRYVIYLLAWISVASIVRRLHDRNKSGWWAVLYAVPVIGWTWCFIECGFMPGRTPPAEPAAPPSVVERKQPRPWTPMRIAKTAVNVVGLSAIGLLWYIWYTATPPKFEGDVRAKFGLPAQQPSTLPE